MMTANRQHLVAALMGLAVLACAASCERPEIVPPRAKLAAGEDSAAFLDRISSQETVSENDAMRGILLLLHGQDKADSFAQRVRMLQAQNAVPQSWSFRGDRPITRGKLAYMIHQICKTPGGAILTLTGPSRRYCLRELYYQGFFTTTVTYSHVGGMEYVSVLSRADSYLETGEVPRVLSASEGQ